jgi:hypothetical protein
MRARKPAATEPESAAAPLPGTTVALGLAVGVGEPKVPVVLEPEPEPPPTLLPPVEPALGLERVPVPVGPASMELCEPGRPVPTPGLPPAREVGTTMLVAAEETEETKPLEEADTVTDEPELAVREAEAELLLEEEL